MPPSLRVRRVYHFKANIRDRKIQLGRPKTRWGDSIKDDLNYTGLNATNAAQMVFERHHLKAFVYAQPTLESDQGP